VLPRCGSNSYVGFNDDDRLVNLCTISRTFESIASRQDPTFGVM
jgi:hypothetical protein